MKIGFPNSTTSQDRFPTLLVMVKAGNCLKVAFFSSCLCYYLIMALNQMYLSTSPAAIASLSISLTSVQVWFDVRTELPLSVSLAAGPLAAFT